MITNQVRSPKSIATLPDILIIDPINDCHYLLPSKCMDSYRVSKKSWESLTPSAVTFVIPSEDFPEEFPPFNSSSDGKFSVLIQHPKGESSYFFDFDQLQNFRIDEVSDYGNYGISFVIPQSLELVEELPPVARALLQSTH